MSYFNLSIKETGPVIVSSEPTTDRLLIIGPALDGPLNQIQPVNSFDKAVALFGPLTFEGIYKNPANDTADGTYSHNELVKAYAEALKTGANNIFLCRTGGQRASASGSAGIGGVTGVSVIAVNPGYLHNDVVVAMASNGTTGSLTVTQPTEKGGTVIYTYGNDRTLGQLIQIVNSDSRTQLVRLTESPSANTYALAVTVSGSVTLSGGTNGTAANGDDNYSSKFALYQSLIQAEYGTFDAIEDFETDLVALAGIYADDQVVTGSGATTTSVIDAFSRYCAKERRENLVHGFIGLRPLGLDRSDPNRVTATVANNWEDATAGYVDANKKWLKFGYFRQNGAIETDTAGNTIDYGACISVVAGPDVRLTLPSIGPYQANPAIIYAATVSTLPSEQAMTKQPVKGTLGTAFSIREKQLRRLVNGIGFNETTRTNGKGALVVLRTGDDAASTEVAYDVTFANDRLPAFSDLQPQRVVAEAIRSIKAVLKPFLGDAFNPNTHMAMEQQVRSVLDKLSEAGKLNDGGEGIGYQFVINGANAMLMANNTVDVQLTLWPAQQIKRISITTTVRE